MGINRTFNFCGPYKNYCQIYADYKRNLGYSFGESSIYMLREMDCFFNKYPMEIPVMTRVMVGDYVSRRGNESGRTQLKRISFIRQFAIFMNNIGFDFYECHSYKISVSTFRPYIFTKEEIHRLISVADNLKPTGHSKKFHHVYPMLVRMLYGCGLRINEALSLHVNDVNIEEGTIIITGAKNNKSRILPMSPSLKAYCTLYVANMGFSQKQVAFFFPSKFKGKYNHSSINEKMKQFMQEAQIYGSNGNLPRIHDIRHTFAVHALEQMAFNGWDIYCTLPILCTYLGHSGIKSTEKYLWFTEIVYDNILESVSPLYEGVFPEVNYDEE